MKTALDPTGKKITDKKIKIETPFFCRPSFCQLLLTTLLLLRAGYGHVSYSSLESIIGQNKEAYYLALRRMQTTWRESSADWPAWLMFFLSGIRQQITRLQQRLDANHPQLSTLVSSGYRRLVFESVLHHQRHPPPLRLAKE